MTLIVFMCSLYILLEYLKSDITAIISDRMNKRKNILYENGLTLHYYLSINNYDLKFNNFNLH